MSERASRSASRANSHAADRWKTYPVKVGELVDVRLTEGLYVAGVELLSEPYQLASEQWVVDVARYGYCALEQVRAHVSQERT